MRLPYHWTIISASVMLASAQSDPFLTSATASNLSAQAAPNPQLQGGKHDNTVKVPDGYWRTALSVDWNHSPQLAKYVEEDIPPTTRNKPFYEKLASIAGTTNQVVPAFGAPLTPSINGMNRILTFYRVSLSTTMKYCFCESPSEHCDPSIATKDLEETDPWKPILEAQLAAIVDMLNNETTVSTLSTLKVADGPPSEDDKLLAKAADFPVSDSHTLRGQLTRLQYGLYQLLYRGDRHDCSDLAVECGKHASNTCSRHPAM